jgi:kanamycin kinase
MNAYFWKRGIGPEVLYYASKDEDIMLTRRVAGEDCTHSTYLSEPKRLCDTIALSLRELHEMDYRDCPIQDRTAEYIRGAVSNYRSGSYDKSHFPDSFGYASAEEAYAVLIDGAEALGSRVLLHGDYCLPNIMLDGWRRSGFIDLGSGGVGDRHIDLFWGAWTLWFNLGTNEYRSRFLDAYGRDVIDEDILKVVAAAEVFG